MGVDFYLFEVRTGRRLTPLPVASGSWTITANADDTISVTISARTAVARTLQIWDTARLAISGLLVVVDGTPIAAGPIWKRGYTQGKSITLDAGGPRSYWERRVLVPVEVRTLGLVDGTGEPITSLDFAATGLSMGTIAKRYIELAQLWPDGALPLVLPADVAGDHEDTVKAIDLKKIRVLLDNLQQRQGGPDIAFVPEWTSDGLGIQWRMKTGTDAVPRLGNTDASLVKWIVGARKGGAFDLDVSEEATGLADEAFAIGGSTADKVVAARAFDGGLIADGAPLLQAAVTGLSDVSTVERVQEYADQRVYLGQFAASFWKMSVRAHEPGTPRLGDYWLGDLATLTVDPAEPVLPAGDVVRRIASISGDEKGHAYALTFAEAVA